jgi:hypothetical protein
MSRTRTGLALSITMFAAMATAAAAAPEGAWHADGDGQVERSDATNDIRLHPSALAQLIDELGGRQISLPRAKIISVISPRAFLVESAGPLAPTPGKLNRVVVLVDKGTLRLDPLSLVGATVAISGVARTVLGMQVTREVAWPPQLTADVVKRYEIRAAVLSPSVRTPDGVELVSQLEP